MIVPMSKYFLCCKICASCISVAVKNTYMSLLHWGTVIIKINSGPYLESNLNTLSGCQIYTQAAHNVC